MADVVESVEKTAKTEVAGVPLWAWGAVLLAGGAIVYILFRHASAASPTLPTVGMAPAGGESSGGGAISVPGTAPSGTTISSNADWLTQAVDAAAKAVGIDPYLAQIYLQDYLAGAPPTGSSAAFSAYDRVVQAALSALGPPPQGVQQSSPSNSIFATTSQWLAAGLAVVRNVSDSVKSELNALVSGQTTTISPAAAQVLQQIEDAIGAPPGTLPYTVSSGSSSGGTGSSGGNPPNDNTQQPSPPSVLQLTEDVVRAWDNAYLSAIGNLPIGRNGAEKLSANQIFQQWVQSIAGGPLGPAFLAKFTPGQLATIFNTINQSVAFNPNSPYRNFAYRTQYLNNLLQNPSLVPESRTIYAYTGLSVKTGSL